MCMKHLLKLAQEGELIVLTWHDHSYEGLNGIPLKSLISNTQKPLICKI